MSDDMPTTTWESPFRVALSLAAAVALCVGTQLVTALPTAADDGPSAPPGSATTTEIPKVDVNAPGLKLGDGATLADPRVLDIKFVTETFGTQKTGKSPSPTAPGTDGPKDRAPGVERREISSSSTKFTLQSDLLFPKGSATLSRRANARLKEIAQEINKQSPQKVNIFGFTDNLGSYKQGIGLSKKRAAAVHQQLIKDVESTKITFNIRGYSEDYPIADNSTEEGRQKNRRVEISFPLRGR